MGDYNRFQAPPAYGGGESLSINVQPSTPQHLNSTAGNTLPGALQPGPMGRPGPLSSNTAPGSIPTVPHISTSMQQPPRSANFNHSHAYSRSSPTNLEQSKYRAFANPSETAKYGSMPQTPQASSYSPLGLADIRPQPEAGFLDDLRSPGLYQGAGDQQYPTNSNYLAPWPIYATDWCKWPPRSHGNHAGKIAIGSYLEDNHNYVRLNTATGIHTCVLTLYTDPNTRCPEIATYQRRPSRRWWTGVCKDRRGHAFISRHKDIMGATLVHQADDRSPGNVWRPPSSMVPPKRSAVGPVELDNSVHQFQRPAHPEAVPACAAV